MAIRRPLRLSLPTGAWTALLEASTELQALLDADGLVVWANPALLQAAGTHEEAGDAAQTLAHTLGLDDQDPHAQALAEAVRAGRPLQLAALSWRDARGEARTAEGRLRPLHDAETLGEARWLWSMRDTTELTRERDEMARVAERLERAQAFGRLGLFERELPMGRGHWDENMFRMWSLDPAQGTPDFATFVARIHPDDRPGVDYRQAARNPGKYAKRYRIQAPGGQWRHVHAQWEVKAGPDGTPQLITGAMVDDTEAYELAESLNTTSAQLRLAVDLGNIAIWRHDLRTQRIHYNDKAFEVIGIQPRPEGLALDEVRALIHPDDIPRVQATAAESLNSDRPVDMEARYRRSDGMYRYVLTRRVVHRNADGEPIEFVGVALDVTEQVSEARRAQELARRLEVAASAAGLGIWSRHPGDERSEWNAQMFEMIGRPPSRGVPRRSEWLSEVIHPDDRERMRSAHAELRATEDVTVEHEYRIVRPDGAVRWLVSRARNEKREGGAVQFGIAIDVTERQEKLVAQRESQAKSEFLARMSHELRTPLNAVLGFSQLLRLEPAVTASGPLDDKVRHIQSAGEHLLSLINDVLDLSSLESGEVRLDLGAVPLAGVLQEAQALLEPAAREAGVSIRVDTTAAVVRADRIRTRQIVLNLLSNAVKYNTARGQVHVSVDERGDEVLLAVADTGRGMTRQQMAHLFEPFNRLGVEREGIEGAGVGLSVVKALAERMGGVVRVESTPGVGSRFEVSLPRHAGAADTAEATPPATEAPVSLPAPTPVPRGGRLLYIEDNPVNALLLEEMVRLHEGVQVESVASGLAGVARAATFQPDLILVDMQLPDIDGHEVLRRLRAQPATAGIRCVALSANAMPEDIERAMAAGFAEYWTKPIQLGVFIAALARLLPG